MKDSKLTAWQSEVIRLATIASNCYERIEEHDNRLANTDEGQVYNGPYRYELEQKRNRAETALFELIDGTHDIKRGQ